MTIDRTNTIQSAYQTSIVSKCENMSFIMFPDKVSHYKQLEGGVVFIDEIPKSPSGKILRRKLKEMALGQSKL